MDLSMANNKELVNELISRGAILKECVNEDKIYSDKDSEPKKYFLLVDLE